MDRVIYLLIHERSSITCQIEIYYKFFAMNKDFQPKLFGLCAMFLAIFLAGCAHPISMSPDLALVNSERIKKLDLTAGYHISNEFRTLEVTGPAGGGDKVRYFPYRDFEAGFEYALSKVFTEVLRIDNLNDSDPKRGSLSVLITPKIETVSSSSNLMTWPPTQFLVTLTCSILDGNGKLVDTLVVSGSGNSEFQDWVTSSHKFSLSAVRASSDALTKLIAALSSSKSLQFAAQKAVELKALENRKTQTPTDFALIQQHKSIEDEKARLAEERRLMDEEKKRRETVKSSTKMDLNVTTTEPDANGLVVISIQTGVDTSSLKINGEELGSNVNGIYSIKKVARVGQETKFVLAATDVYGNTDSKTITVVRQAVDSKAVFSQLNAANVKQQPTRDAVAIIIGIEKYKRVAKADFANADAQVFYDYASRALGIKPENIKLLVDDGADDAEIYRAFQNWLPLKVKKGKTEVFVFFSGHGLPSQDGKSLYLLPWGVDKDFVEKTAINQQEIIASLQAVQPKSVTMFLDSCYSGQARGGETLLASARPIALKAEANAYPPNFTVISASAPDQLSSSSPDLKHGIFSYYLMKGMEGDADQNKDGKITVAEIQEYLTDMVGRQAMGMNRKQQPQLFGDADRVLVGR
jgi:hypothetical protein